MAFFNDSEKQQLRDAIRAVEMKTRGEIVTVVARASGNYFYYPALWAALLAILAPLLPIALGVPFATLGIIEVQLLAFVLLTALFRWPPLKMRLVPSSVKQQYCARRAREQFLAQNLHTTRDRTGVLLYVSVAEHYVEVIADEGIHTRVPEGTWHTLVNALTARIKAGQIGDGFIEAVQAIGGHLQTHFPAEAENPNELPDHLIEI